MSPYNATNGYPPHGSQNQQQSSGYHQNYDQDFQQQQQPNYDHRFNQMQQHFMQQQQQFQRQLQEQQQQQQQLQREQSNGGSKIKCVFLGDGAVGKTSLIVSYTTNGYPSEYVPTAIDTYDVTVNVDGEPLTLEMVDTPGQDDFDTLRPFAYTNTDVFVLCFSVVSPSSFVNIKEKWCPEIKKFRKRTPVILVGTQSDLRADAVTLANLTRVKEAPVSEAEAKKLVANNGFELYMESSALTQKNLKEVFDEAIVAGLKGRRKKEKAATKKEARKQSCIGRTCTIL